MGEQGRHLGGGRSPQVFAGAEARACAASHLRGAADTSQVSFEACQGVYGSLRDDDRRSCGSAQPPCCLRRLAWPRSLLNTAHRVIGSPLLAQWPPAIGRAHTPSCARRTACGRGCTACAHGVERLCGARAPITITTPNGSRALLRTACSASHTWPGVADRRGQASTPSSMLLLSSAARALAQSEHRSGLARRTPLRPLPPAQRRSAPRDAPVSQIRGDGHSAHSTVWPVAAHASPARQ